MNIKKIRYILWLVLSLSICWLLFLKVVPKGRISYVYDFKKGSFFISQLTPKDRVEEMKDGLQTIIGDPVYFSLFTPRRFDQAVVSLRFMEKSAPKTRPIIEAGLLADKTVWRYDLKPIYNQMISELSKIWEKDADGDVILLTRNGTAVKKFKNIDEFLSDLPKRENIALYNYDLDYPYKIIDYLPSDKKTIINYPLRGTWQLYIYLKNEELSFDIKLTDLNLNNDQDPADLDLYYDSQLIDSRHLADDGQIGSSGKISQNKITIGPMKLPEGVYKLELKAGDDLITKEITGRQNKISFINKLWLSAGQKITLYSDSHRLEAVTDNPSSQQTVKVNGQPFAISETYKQFVYTTSSPVSEITLDTGDLIISGNGLFAFAKDSLFDPDLKKVDANFNPDSEAVDYILARYEQPSKENGWFSADAVFDLNLGYRENGRYNFIISIPGLRADDNMHDGIILDKIEIKLSGKNIIDYAKKIFKF